MIRRTALLLAVSVGSVQAVALPATGVAAPNAPNDIRDIRGPEPIASPWLWAMGLGAGAVIVAAGYGAYRWNRRRQGIGIKLEYEIALDRLESARSLMRPETVRGYSIAVSDIVRHYIEQRFLVMATHRTTQEFLRQLLDPSMAMLAAHRESLAEFLNHCDLVKFGGWSLSLERMEAMHQSARSFILITGKPELNPAKPDIQRSADDKDIYDSLPAT
jgi:hypothetical protein